MVVGAFEYDADGNLFGPPDYFEEKGVALFDAMVAGNDPVYNIALTIPGNDPIHALLSRLELDYVSWQHAGRLAR